MCVQLTRDKYRKEVTAKKTKKNELGFLQDEWLRPGCGQREAGQKALFDNSGAVVYFVQSADHKPAGMNKPGPLPTERYFILNKPYNMVSQFVSSHAVGLIGDLGLSFPKGIHAVGRLDNLSEGLLILTTNKKITRLLFEAATPHKRTYLVQVNHSVTAERLNRLRQGVPIRVKGGEYYTAASCDAEIISDPGISFPAPYEMTSNISYTWLRITLTEGKYHQVRKMVAAIHHRCKRLVRIAIEDLELGDLQPGCVREIAENDFFRLLRINTDTVATIEKSKFIR